MLKLKPLLLLALCGLSIQAFAAAPKASNGMLVDDKGMTLYTFDKDTTPGQERLPPALAQRSGRQRWHPRPTPPAATWA